MSKESVLVALVKDKNDHAILHEQRWYRIPVDKAPVVVRNRAVRYVGFYLPSVFGKDQRWKVHHYGKVRQVSEVSRQELFPEEPSGSRKADTRYYKIEMEALLPLEHPIVSTKGHRLLFVPTTEQKFFHARNVNHLFNASPLEDILFDHLERLSIPSERQWLIEMKKRKYCLDFAIFCKNKPINIECDGDGFHLAPDQVKYDKMRNNELTSQGWSVLRFHTDLILHGMEGVIEKIADTINQNGGLKGKGYLNIPRPPKNGQLNLFN